MKTGILTKVRFDCRPDQARNPRGGGRSELRGPLHRSDGFASAGAQPVDFGAERLQQSGQGVTEALISRAPLRCRALPCPGNNRQRIPVSKTLTDVTRWVTLLDDIAVSA